MNVLVKLSDRLVVNLAQVSTVERSGQLGCWWLWMVGRANAIELTDAERDRLQCCLADIGGKYRDLTVRDLTAGAGHVVVKDDPEVTP